MTANETSPQLTSAWNLAKAQFWAVPWSLLRVSTWTFGILSALLIFLLAERFVMAAHVTFSYSAQFGVLPFAVFAILAAGSVWPRTGRQFEWSMPASRLRYGALKYLVSSVYIAVAAVAYLVLINVASRLISSHDILARRASIPVWQYVALLTTGQILFTIASAAAIAAMSPLRWLIGLVVTYGALLLLASVIHASAIAAPLFGIYDGHFGVSALLAPSSYSAWRGATALWATVAAVLLVAALRRPTRA